MIVSIIIKFLWCRPFGKIDVSAAGSKALTPLPPPPSLSLPPSAVLYFDCDFLTSFQLDVGSSMQCTCT